MWTNRVYNKYVNSYNTENVMGQLILEWCIKNSDLIFMVVIYAVIIVVCLLITSNIIKREEKK
jgi:hypothetical protein